MNRLKIYLRELGDDTARIAFAERCGTTYGHIRNSLYDPNVVLHPAVCVKIERETKKQVRRFDLRPEDWMEIWPELVTTIGSREAARGASKSSNQHEAPAASQDASV